VQAQRFVKLRWSFVLASGLAAGCAMGELEEGPPTGPAPAVQPLADAGPAPEVALRDAAAPDASRPDAATPDAEPAWIEVPGVGLRMAPTEATRCGDRHDQPILPEEAASAPAWGKRAFYELEESGGLDPGVVLRDDDRSATGDAIIPTTRAVPALAGALDPDGDCLSTADELLLGTDPANPDTDGDGWFDGPCNERRKLILVRIQAHDEQEDFGDDEFYLVVDDVRHPQRDLDDYWDFDHGDVMNTSWLLATRVRGVSTPGLARVRVEGWEDDPEIFNTWTVDDLLFVGDIDLGAYGHGETFTRRFIDPGNDYDYELTFRVDIETFADPSPLDAHADRDGDGISERDEARVTADLGGLADPERPDLFVEVDWMRGHPLRTQAKRQVVTQLFRNGVNLTILRDQELPLDRCLTVPDARRLYADHFDRKGFGAYRYAIIGERIWNDASGVAWGDLFIVDDSTWWINGWVLPQAATFLHELGHTLGLNNRVFRLIDTTAWFSYDSAMNYLYQATKVDFSHDGAGGSSFDHDDWAVVDPAYALKWSFGLVTSDDVGACE
jgi:hypothetical protein